jgi:hypothetical protein
MPGNSKKVLKMPKIAIFGKKAENRGKPWFLVKMAKSGVWEKSECPWQSIFPTFDPRRL